MSHFVIRIANLNQSGSVPILRCPVSKMGTDPLGAAI